VRASNDRLVLGGVTVAVGVGRGQLVGSENAVLVQVDSLVPVNVAVAVEVESVVIERARELCPPRAVALESRGNGQQCDGEE